MSVVFTNPRLKNKSSINKQTQNKWTFFNFNSHGYTVLSKDVNKKLFLLITPTPFTDSKIFLIQVQDSNLYFYLLLSQIRLNESNEWNRLKTNWPDSQCYPWELNSNFQKCFVNGWCEKSWVSVWNENSHYSMDGSASKIWFHSQWSQLRKESLMYRFATQLAHIMA